MAKNSAKSPSRIITLRIPKELDDVIDAACRELGYSSKSAFVRDAINDYIDYLMSSLDESALEEPAGDVEVSAEGVRVIII